MPRIVEYDFHMIVNLNLLVIKHRHYVLQRLHCVFIGVKRLNRRFSRTGGSFALPLRVFFVNKAAVLQHDIEKICSCIRTIDFSGKATLYKQRNSAAVVDMGMTQNHAFHFLRIKRKRLVIQRFLRLSALKLSTIEQNLMIFCCQ